MNAFFRSALFPLIVIVLLVYLASQTLMSDGPAKRDVSYDQAVQTLRQHPQRIDEITLRPREREATIRLADGSTATAAPDKDLTPWLWWVPFVAVGLVVGVTALVQNRKRVHDEEDLTAQVRNRSTA